MKCLPAAFLWCCEIPLDTFPLITPEKLLPGGNLPPFIECSNILKAKIWNLALTRTSDPIRPMRRGHDPNRPSGLPLGNFLWGVGNDCGKCLQEGLSLITIFVFHGILAVQRTSDWCKCRSEIQEYRLQISGFRATTNKQTKRQTGTKYLL